MDRSLHALHQTLADGQSQAGTAEIPRGGGVGLHKGVEDLIDLFRAHADAGITDMQMQPFFPVGDTQMHLPLMGKLDGVAEQIEQNLLQPVGIAMQLQG